MDTIIITENEFDKAQEYFQHLDDFHCLRAPEDEASLADAIREAGAQYVIVGVKNYSHELYEAIPRGGVIARFGVGHDGIDKKLAARHGIFCTNTPGVLDASVAECAAGMLLLAARHFVDCIQKNRLKIWQSQMGTELAGKRLAIIGCGNIGTRLAAIARNGFNMIVSGFDSRTPRQMACYDFFSLDFEAAVTDADFVSLHIPDCPGTRNFLNSERLSQVKPGAWVINTARGTVVDEDALYDAVLSGHLGGAVLDVFQHEPYQPQGTKDLRRLDRVLMTPHIASSTHEACLRMAQAAVHNIRLCKEGRLEDMSLVS